MNTAPPLRVLRARANAFTRPELARTAFEHKRHETIIDASRALMAEFGRNALTFTALAKALTMSRSTLERHFVDLDSILGEILTRHLIFLSKIIGDIAPDTPHCQQQRRAAYWEATRSAGGAFTEAHGLYLRERQAMPPDLAEGIEASRLALGQLLAGELAEEALALLDSPGLDPDRIEARLGTPATPPVKLPRPQLRIDPPPPNLVDIAYTPSATKLDFLFAGRAKQNAPATAPPR